MDEKTMLILRGQNLIIDMLQSIMPSSLSEMWLNDVNEYNQAVVEFFGRAGFTLRPNETEQKTKE